MSAELEVLDQLEGGDLPLDVIVGLFPELEHCRRALRAMLRAGELLILDAGGEAVPEWRFRELESEPKAWSSGTPYRVSITDAGAKRIG